MLPDIEQAPDGGTRDSDALPYPGLLRHSHRLREIALQQMIEGTARARLGRALNTKTLPAGQIEGYKVGEEVDFYRPPSTKDVSGWMGPATVVDVSELSRGHISIRFQRGAIARRLADGRRHLHFFNGNHASAWQ